MGADNDENYHNKIDDEDHLDDKEDGMGDKPGEELGGTPPDCAEVQEEVGDQEERQED